MKLTRTGGAYIGITLLLGFAAVNTGNNLLYLIVAALLAFMAATGVAGKRNIEGYSLDLDVPEEIYTGVETLLRVRVANRRRFLPAFLLRIDLDGASVLLPFIPCGAEGSVSLPYRPARRGRNRIAQLRISSPFPVAFFVRSNSFALDGELVAFPAPLPLATLAGGEGLRPQATGRTSPLRGAQGEIAGIYDYTGTEPLKRIHWRLSARHDTLKVKELESDASEPVTIEPERLPGATLEARLSGATWLIDRYLRGGRSVGLRLGPHAIAPASGREHRLRLLRTLALHDAD